MKQHLCAASLLLSALLSPALAVSGPSQEELNTADQATDSWLMYNKGYMGQRYSPLDQVNADNVSGLRRVCTFDTKDDGGFQATPQMYKGVLFFTQMYRTFAIDAATCKPLWVHKYKPAGTSVLTTNRGVAIADGVIYRGTPDAHLIALDAGTGKPLWDTKVADSSVGYFLSAAPVVYNGRVYIGEAGADWGIKAHMYAFDAKTGKKAWTFDLIPTGSQYGANTWQKADSTATGGGSTWTSYTIDAATGLLYVSVGNPAPDFAAQYRPGDNLFTNSVVALNAETGARPVRRERPEAHGGRHEGRVAVQLQRDRQEPGVQAGDHQGHQPGETHHPRGPEHLPELLGGHAVVRAVLRPAEQHPGRPHRRLVRRREARRGAPEVGGCG